MLHPVMHISLMTEHVSRRQIQLKAGQQLSLAAGASAIMQRGGIGAFYAGFLPNALKNLPNKGAHLLLCLGTHW